MGEPENIDRRVTRLEGEVAKVREDAAAARVLAGGADRDVSAMQAELRAHTRTLNALRETQISQGAEMRGEMREMRGEMRDMRGGFALLAQGQERITDLLTRHIDECDSGRGC